MSFSRLETFIIINYRFAAEAKCLRRFCVLTENGNGRTNGHEHGHETAGKREGNGRGMAGNNKKLTII
jgi:hypothetical protein